MWVRYRRKGTSSLGLDCRKQEISWEDSKKKSKQKGDRGADRYFSTASRHLLRSEPSVSVTPATPDSGEGNNSTPFLPLDDPERNVRGQETSKWSHDNHAYWKHLVTKQEETRNVTYTNESNLLNDSLTRTMGIDSQLTGNYYLFHSFFPPSPEFICSHKKSHSSNFRCKHHKLWTLDSREHLHEKRIEEKL